MNKEQIDKWFNQAIWLWLSSTQRKVAIDYKNKHWELINLEKLYKITE